MTQQFRSTLLKILGAAALATPQAVAASAGEQADADVAAVLHVNKTILDANMRGDPSGVRDLSVEKLRVLAPGGRLEDKELVIKGVGTVVGDLTSSNEEVLIVGDTAILTGKLEGNAVMEPFGKLPTMKYIATFVRTEQGWRLLSRALTPCARVAIERGVC